MPSEPSIHTTMANSREKSNGIRRQPPTVRGLPLLGNAMDMRKDTIKFFFEAYKQHGPVFRINVPTAQDGPITVLAGPKANLFAAHHGHRYLSTQRYFQKVARESGTPNYLPALEGNPHSHMRKCVKHGLASEGLGPTSTKSSSLRNEKSRIGKLASRIAR